MNEELVSEDEAVAVAPGGEDFKALFEASYAANRIKRLTNGQAVEGTIVALGGVVALVDVGAKS